MPDIESSEFSYATDVIRTIIKRGEDAEKGIYPPIYYGTLNDAIREGKHKEYSNSHGADVDCCGAIRWYLFARGGIPRAQKETDSFIRDWGTDRISYLLACTVRFGYPHDKSFSDENILWAMSIPLTDDFAHDSGNMILSDPVNLNWFMDQVRDNIRRKTMAAAKTPDLEEQAQNPQEAVQAQERAPAPVLEEHEASPENPSESAQEAVQANEQEQTPVLETVWKEEAAESSHEQAQDAAQETPAESSQKAVQANEKEQTLEQAVEQTPAQTVQETAKESIQEAPQEVPAETVQEQKPSETPKKPKKKSSSRKSRTAKAAEKAAAVAPSEAAQEGGPSVQDNAGSAEQTEKSAGTETTETVAEAVPEPVAEPAEMNTETPEEEVQETVTEASGEPAEAVAEAVAEPAEMNAENLTEPVHESAGTAAETSAQPAENAMNTDKSAKTHVNIVLETTAKAVSEQTEKASGAPGRKKTGTKKTSKPSTIEMYRKMKELREQKEKAAAGTSGKILSEAVAEPVSEPSVKPAEISSEAVQKDAETVAASVPEFTEPVQGPDETPSKAYADPVHETAANPVPEEKKTEEQAKGAKDFPRNGKINHIIEDWAREMTEQRAKEENPAAGTSETEHEEAVTEPVSEQKKTAVPPEGFKIVYMDGGSIYMVKEGDKQKTEQSPQEENPAAGTYEKAPEAAVAEASPEPAEMPARAFAETVTKTAAEPAAAAELPAEQAEEKRIIREPVPEDAPDKENKNMAVKSKTLYDGGRRTTRDKRTDKEIELEAEELRKVWEQEEARMAAESAGRDEEPQPMAGGAGNGSKDTKITMQNAENGDLHSTHNDVSGGFVPPDMEEAAASGKDAEVVSVSESAAAGPVSGAGMEETGEEDPFVKGGMAPPAAPAASPVEPGKDDPAPAPAPAPGQPRTLWLSAIVSDSARIRKYDKSSFMRMPINGGYAGYTYNFANRFIDPNLIKVEKAGGKGTEDALVLSFPEHFTFTLTSRDEGKEPVTLTAKQFFEAVNGTRKNDYVSPRKRGERNWIVIRIPAAAYVAAEDENMYDTYRFNLPDRSRGDLILVPKFLAEKQVNGDYVCHIPDDKDVRVWHRNKTAGRITVANLKDVMESSKPEDYMPGEVNMELLEKYNRPEYVMVPKTARICDTPASKLFRMPDGAYEKFSYYYPASLITELDEGYELIVPKSMSIRIFNGRETQALVPDAFAEMLGGSATYTNEIERPSGIIRGKIFTHERQLRENVPEEMKAKPNWVVLRTRPNERTGRLDKFLIDPNTGKYAESDNPSTWTDFETAMEYARTHGGDTLAYALDGKDGICCIDVDDCLDENGSFTPAAARARAAVPAGSYAETSVSGKGIHFFGRMEPTDVRSFSKDGKTEFYRKSHFISMTGACREGETKLESFDTPDMRYFIRNNFEKRAQLKKTGNGLNGLSQMSDRDVLEKAFSAKGGEITMQLFEGNDLRHNHSNSDMALMNRLAFWCNGDKEQMMRIFAASGLYRPEKSQDYYECTIIKAIAETPDRYDPDSYRRKAEEERAREAAARKSQSEISYATTSSPYTSSLDEHKGSKPVYGRYGHIKGYTENNPEQGE
ncbi:MAG: DUF3849 domain-containing protein [Clostridia bacterium]|nr:DUF3849 domain-containing protein [Clostridia bacterium]